MDLEDIKFHQCVRLTEFDENRQIVFTPPDGKFELMSYRLSQLELTPPFWVECQVERFGTSRIEFMVKIRSQFKQKVQAQKVEVAVPCPPDCQNPVTKQSAVRVHQLPASIMHLLRHFLPHFSTHHVTLMSSQSSAVISRVHLNLPGSVQQVVW